MCVAAGCTGWGVQVAVLQVPYPVASEASALDSAAAGCICHRRGIRWHNVAQSIKKVVVVRQQELPHETCNLKTNRDSVQRVKLRYAANAPSQHSHTSTAAVLLRAWLQQIAGTALHTWRQ